MDIAQLGLSIDSTQVKEAIKELDRLQEAAEKSEDATKKLEVQNLKLAKSWLEQAQTAGMSRAEVIRFQADLKNLTGDARVAAEAAAKIFEEKDAAAAMAKKTSAAFELGEMLGNLAKKALGAVGAVFTLKSAIESVTAFSEAEEVSNRLAISFAVTGRNAEAGIPKIEKLAASMQELTRFDDESIKRATTTLTRFTSIADKDLERATKLSLDLAEALGQDVTSSAQTLGRAMETSFGAQMLRKQGLLNEEQARTIKNLKEMNRDAEAQEALFAALESRVGGTAAALGSQGLGSAFTQLQNELGDTSESIGEVIADLLSLETRVRGLSELVRDARTKGIGGVVNTTIAGVLDSLGIQSMEKSLGASFEREQTARLAARQEQAMAQGISVEQLAQQERAAATAAKMEAERNEYLKTRIELGDKILGQMDQDDQKLKTKADVVRFVNEQWKAGNTAFMERFATEAAAVAKLTEMYVKKEQVAKAKPLDMSVYKEMVSDFAKVEERLEGVTAEQKAYNEAVEAIIAFMPYQKDQARTIELLGKAYDKLHPSALSTARVTKEVHAATEQQRKSMEDANKNLEEQLKSEKEKYATLGMTKNQLVEYTNAQHDANIAIAAAELAVADEVGATAQYKQSLMDRIKLLQELKKVANDTRSKEAWQEGQEHASAALQRTFDEASEGADQMRQDITDALMRGFEDGKDAAQNFKDTLLNMFKTMILRPTLQLGVQGAMGGLSSMLGGNAGGGLGNMLGLGGNPFGNVGQSLLGFGGGLGEVGAGMLGGIPGTANFIGPMMPGMGAAGGMMGSLGTFGAGLASPFATMGAGFGALGAGGGLTGALGAMGGIAGALGAVMPVIGIGLAIASALGAFDKSIPKTGGSSGTGIDLSNRSTWDVGQRMFTPNDHDDIVDKITDDLAKSYGDIAKKLGAKTGSAEFLLGFDAHEEHGNRVSGLARVNGRDVYTNKDISVGDDQEDIEAGLALEAKRAVLAALQASDLPTEIAAILDDVVASTADATQVDNILRSAAAMQSVIDVLSKDISADGIEAYQNSLRGMDYVLEAARENLDTLIDGYDGSTEAAEALSGAASELYVTAMQAVTQIEALRDSIGSMFEDSIMKYEMADLSDSQKYDYVGEQIKAWAKELETATDPTRINQLAQNINQGQNTLFGMLTPEEQRTASQEFINSANAANDLAQQRLSAASEKITSASEAMISDVRNVMFDTANKFSAAADKMLEAAEIISTTPPGREYVFVPNEAGDVTGGG